MKRQIILRVVAKLLIPYILLFALYVQFHGDYGPGGGFQAGVIFAAAFILYALIFGLENARRVARPAMLEVLAALGVLLYAGVGIAAMLRGGNFLAYSVLAHDPAHGQHLGILLVELGVGLTVTPRHQDFQSPGKPEWAEEFLQPLKATSFLQLLVYPLICRILRRLIVDTDSLGLRRGKRRRGCCCEEEHAGDS